MKWRSATAECIGSRPVSDSGGDSIRRRKEFATPSLAPVLGTPPLPPPPPLLPQHSEDGEVSDRRASHLGWWCGPGTGHDASDFADP